MKNNTLFITIIVAVVVGAAAFFGGILYQKSQASTTSGQFGQGGNGQGRGAGRRNGGATIGQVVGEDANSITVQLQDGSSKIINISSSTTFNKTAPAAKSDVQTGTRVAAFGTPNSDGSITAQSIQINPMMGMRGGRPGQGSPQPSQ